MENQKSNSKFYLLGCFAPSYDRYHQQTQLMHLVGSVFYTTKLNWDDVISKYYRLDNVAIFKVVKDIKYCYFKPDQNIFYISSYQFFGFLLDNKSSDFITGNLLDQIFKGNHGVSASKYLDIFFRNSFFIFEGLSWNDLQIFYRRRLIQISGGSTNRRHLLSTLQYRLSKHLMDLNYSVDDVYNSTKVLKNIVYDKSVYDWQSLQCDYIKNIVYTLVDEEITKLEAALESIKNGDSKNKIINYDLYSKQDIENLITIKYNFKFDLDTMSFDELKAIYDRDYFNQHKSFDAQLKGVIDRSPLFIKLNKAKLRIDSQKYVRKYSTFVIKSPIES